MYSDTLELDLSTIVPSLAGPKRPQDRVELGSVKSSFQEHLTLSPSERGFGFGLSGEEAEKTAVVGHGVEAFQLQHGSVVIAAITSCTNTSNPSVMIGSGLLAKNAVTAGITTKPWVKTSMAPGSKVVTDYLEAAGTGSVPGGAAIPHGGFRLHDVHRQLRDRCRRTLRMPSRTATLWPRPSCPAIGTSRAG